MMVQLTTRTGGTIEFREETVLGWEWDDDRIYIYTQSNGTHVIRADPANTRVLTVLRNRLDGAYTREMLGDVEP